MRAVVVVDVGDEGVSRPEIMKEGFRDAVREMPQEVLELWLRQHKRLARMRPEISWRYEILNAEYDSRSFTYQSVG
jgi:hypothetical protein